MAKGEQLENYLGFLGEHFFEAASLILAAGALIFAALAFRVAKQAIAINEASELAILKLKAFERRTRAERGFLSLQSHCQDFRNRWHVHHDRHGPKLSSQDFRKKDIRNIDEVENKGRNLLKPFAHDISEMEALDAAALKDYIQRADQSALRIEQLAFRLSPPKQLFN